MKTPLLLALLSCTAFADGIDGIDDFDDWAAQPKDRFENGAKTFEAAKKELLEKYLKDDLTEDDLYRAALAGMLARLDPAMRSYNRLLTPGEFAELNADLKGEAIGVGLQLTFEPATGRAEVLGIVRGSPAEKADLREGDVVLTVDGASFKGKQLRDIVYAIRGKVNEKVTLGVLRDAAVLTKTVERQKLVVESVTFEVLPGDVAVIAIRSFNETTPQAAREALAKAAKAGAKALIIDLRDDEGGLLEKALETAKLFLPKGKVITRVLHRGNKEETIASDVEPVFGPVPTVVLINGHTRSSAELLAAALREGLKAPLVGAKTAGKWSVQSLKELPNRYVLKYTLALFRAPDGKSYEGVGLSPDIEVTQDERAAGRAARLKVPAERLAIDAQLRAAASFLRLR
ncbi:MAG: S41 family peptidase [Archangium sp.]|nr:S41 family peptidase [Archangium sp.]